MGGKLPSTVDPAPDSIHRLWLYFGPIDEPADLPEPNVEPLTRDGFTVVELGFLSDVEVADEALPEVTRGTKTAGRLLSGVRDIASDELNAVDSGLEAAVHSVERVKLLRGALMFLLPMRCSASWAMPRLGRPMQMRMLRAGRRFG
jgi:hypothetical protein